MSKFRPKNSQFFTYLYFYRNFHFSARGAEKSWSKKVLTCEGQRINETVTTITVIAVRTGRVDFARCSVDGRASGCHRVYISTAHYAQCAVSTVSPNTAADYAYTPL